MLIPTNIKLGHVILHTQAVIVGSKFDGPNGFVDTQNGIYWETMLELSDNETLIQKALLWNKP